MGADLYLNSVFEPWWAKNQVRAFNAPDCDSTSEMRASGGYFRNSYNSGDVMWAMGLSWPHTVGNHSGSAVICPSAFLSAAPSATYSQRSSIVLDRVAAGDR